MLKHALLISLLAAVVMSVGCGSLRSKENLSSAAIDANKYYAVLLSNGSVYFGKLEGLDTPYPVLKEVYYVQSLTHPESKAVSNILVRRGKEWHGPDRMILNEKAIVFVEPVGADSKVAQLIAESKK